MRFFRNNKSIFIISGIVAAVVLLLAVAGFYVITNYRVTTVYVDGNTHYSDEEIRNMVLNGFMSDNSLVLSLRYKDKSIKDVPFISKMDVNISDPNTVRIVVYEKAVAGYVEYLEKYMYFDKDGVVIEATSEKTVGVPQVSGLKFDHVVIHEMLPVSDPSVFESILTITQLINKYELMADKIYFSKDGSITLFFNEVRVALGDGSDLEEKVMKLEYILPELEGQKGVLRMENFTEDSTSVSFNPDEDIVVEEEEVLN